MTLRDYFAFPADSPFGSHFGMTLRDYFAAKAMQEMIGVFNAADGCKRAYEWADAMLEEREK